MRNLDPNDPHDKWILDKRAENAAAADAYETIYIHHPVMRGVPGLHRTYASGDRWLYPYWCHMYDADDQLMAIHKATLKEFSRLENTYNGGFRRFVFYSDAITKEQIPLVMTIKTWLCKANGELQEMPHKVFTRAGDTSIWEERTRGRKPSSDPQLRNPRWSTNQE
jgi:hypothetical protein